MPITNAQELADATEGKNASMGEVLKLYQVNRLAGLLYDQRDALEAVFGIRGKNLVWLRIIALMKKPASFFLDCSWRDLGDGLFEGLTQTGTMEVLQISDDVESQCVHRMCGSRREVAIAQPDLHRLAQDANAFLLEKNSELPARQHSVMFLAQGVIEDPMRQLLNQAYVDARETEQMEQLIFAGRSILWERLKMQEAMPSK